MILVLIKEADHAASFIKRVEQGDLNPRVFTGGILNLESWFICPICGGVVSANSPLGGMGLNILSGF